MENHHIAITTIRADLLKAFTSHGYRVYVLAEVDQAFRPEQVSDGVTVVDVGKSALSPASAARYCFRLYRILRHLRPDLCLTFTIRPAILGNIAAGVSGTRAVSTITGTGPLFESGDLTYRTARWLYRWVLKRTKRVIFPNSDDLEAFVSRGYVRREVAVRVAGSGVNLAHFSPRAPATSADHRFVFLFISRLIKDKGILEFVRAAPIVQASHPHAEFHVIGPVWERNKRSLTVTRADIEDWSERGWIRYLGEQEDVRPFMADADCVVMPSYREGMSNVLLEACSMARPVIATDVTGCRDIVRHGDNGLLCKPRDAEDLARQMVHMLDLSQEERRAMGERGRSIVTREFAKTKVIETYLTVVREALDEPRS